MQHDLSFLPYFIPEDIFLLPEDRQSQAKPAAPEAEKVAAKPANIPAKEKADPQAKPASPPAAQKAPAEKAAASANVNPKLIFGENRKGLLILVEDAKHPVMERADGLFLKDVLKAIGYTFDDVAIVNICQCLGPADWEAVNSISCTHLMSFGVSHAELPAITALEPYKLESSKDRRYLKVDKLSILRTDRSLKIALWNLLKQVFV